MTDSRALFKNRVIWTSGFMWLIVGGVIHFFISYFTNLQTAIFPLSLLTIVVMILTGAKAHAPNSFSKAVFVYAWQPLLSWVINVYSPKSFDFSISAALTSVFGYGLVYFIFSAILAFLFIRFVTGIDKSEDYKGKSFSFRLSSASTDSPLQLLQHIANPLYPPKKSVGFLEYDSEPKLKKFDGFTAIEFPLEPNEYVFCYRQIAGDDFEFEVNVLAYRRENDILVNPDDDAAEEFFASLYAIGRVWEKRGAISKLKEVHGNSVEGLQQVLIRRLTTPYKFELPKLSRESLSQVIVSLSRYAGRHPLWFGLFTTVLGGVIVAILTGVLRLK